MAAGEDRDQQLLEDRVLADDDLGHLGLELGERVLQALDGGEVVFVLQGCRAGCESLTHVPPIWSLELNAQMPLDVARIAPRGSSLNVTSEIVVGNTNRWIKRAVIAAADDQRACSPGRRPSESGGTGISDHGPLRTARSTRPRPAAPIAGATRRASRPRAQTARSD